MIPYDGSFDDDDDDRDLSPLPDSRFLHLDCPAECLLDAEDIDFEFVYALHTFVATVEGQANATKGDTMVLLDDSNSYWWLVRVVKDSSIGMLFTPRDENQACFILTTHLRRILTCGAHRDPYGEIGTPEQAQKR